MNIKSNIAESLQEIAYRALDILQAEFIILLPYENQTFSSFATLSGNFSSLRKDAPLEILENGLLHFIVQTGSIYAEDESHYAACMAAAENENFNAAPAESFWQREKIRSLALIRLDSHGECVGLMIVGYRKKHIFDRSAKKLIETFALLASSTIINVRLLEQNTVFWESRRRDSFNLGISEIITALAHNSGNLLAAINSEFIRFELRLDKNKDKLPDRNEIQQFLEKLRSPLDELNEDFIRLQGYRKFTKFRSEPHKIIPLINSCIRLLSNKFEKKKITIDTRSMSQDATIICDSNQIQHLFLNLFINAVEAMGQRGTLSLGTEIKGDFIVIRVSDDGRGIAPDNRSQVFELFFTTKQESGGTGLGLPISKYIAEVHGGNIEFGRSFHNRPGLATRNIRGKGASFFVYLPYVKEKSF